MTQTSLVKGPIEKVIQKELATVIKATKSGKTPGSLKYAQRIRWIKFIECEELLLGRKFWLKMKGKIYKSCVRSTMLYRSETWCLRKNETAIRKRTKKSIVMAIRS